METIYSTSNWLEDPQTVDQETKYLNKKQKGSSRHYT